MRLLEDASPKRDKNALRWYAVVAVCLSYAAVAAATIWSYAMRSDVPMPFLAAGVYWGGLFLTSTREWRFIVPCIFAVQLGLDLWIYNAPVVVALVFALSKSLEGFAGVAFLRFGQRLIARRYYNKVGRFLLVGGAGVPFLFALAPALSRETPGSVEFYSHILQWSLVQGSGIVLVTPLLLGFWLIAHRPEYLTRRLPEATALVTLGLTILLLPILVQEPVHPAILFLSTPLLFVVAGRFGLLGAVAGNAIFGAGTILMIWLEVFEVPNFGEPTKHVASLCAFLLANSGASLIIGASGTDRANSVHAARRAQQRLRELALAAQEAEDAYRKEIAEVLHDDLGQNLALIRMRLDLLSERIDAKARPALSEIRDAVDATIASGRSITTGVASSIFRGDDLGQALQQLLDSFEAELEVATELTLKHKVQIDKQLAAKLFRCTREILLNVLKHANAKKVSVEISSENDLIRITIVDDGDGFDPKVVSRDHGAGHYGLSSCDNTLESLGGGLQIISSPGNGTTVIMTALSGGLGHG